LSVLVMLTVFANRPAGAYLYGEEEKKLQILINKMVKSPLEADWHENLSSDERTFASNDYVEFKITVKNIGEKDLTNVRFTDFLPDFVNPVSNPGEFDSSNNQVKWKIDKLIPGEEKEFHIKVQVADSNKLATKSLFCLVNRSNVDTEEGQSDSDSTHFCVNPQILGAKLPEAGISLWLSTLIGGGLLGLGIAARKFGRGEIFA